MPFSQLRERRRSVPSVEMIEGRLLLSTLAHHSTALVRALDASDCVPVSLSSPIPSPIPTKIIINILDQTRQQADGRYGGRRSNSKGYHQGLDIAAEQGTPVRSVMSGVILPSKKGGLDGNKVRVRNDDGTISVYSHLGAGGLRRRKPGGDFANRIEAGQVIGRVGRSGNVPRGSRTHLHFQMFSPEGIEIVPNIRPWDPESLLAPGFCIDVAHSGGSPTSPVAPTPPPASAPVNYTIRSTGSFSDGPFYGSPGFPSSVTVDPGQNAVDVIATAFTNLFTANADGFRSQLRPGESFESGGRNVTLYDVTYSGDGIQGSYISEGGSGASAYRYSGSFTAGITS